MRVILNQSTALGKKTGIGHYTHALLHALRAVSAGDDFDVFPPSWWASARRLGSSLRPQRGGPEKRPGEATWKTSLSQQLRTLGDRTLAGYLNWSSPWRPYDLYHEPNAIPLASSIPTVATVCDLSVLLHPEWHPADRVAYFERSLRQALPQCRHFLTISEFSRREMIEVLNLPAAKITCTYLGVRPELRPVPAAESAATVRRLGLPASYLLFVGTIEPRKNLLMLMRAYCDLPAEVRARCPLVLAGAWGWNASAFRDYYEQEGRARGVLQLGYVPDEDLAALYSAARALVFPSFYEGFGLPPLEMMACGGAVLAGTAEAVVETVGSQVHLLAPADLEGWRDAMQRVILDDDWQHELQRGGIDLARGFTWERCARETLEVYREVAGPSARVMQRRAG